MAGPMTTRLANLGGRSGPLTLGAPAGRPDHRTVWIDQRGSEALTTPEWNRLLAVAVKKGSIGRLGRAGMSHPSRCRSSRLWASPLKMGHRGGEVCGTQAPPRQRP
jgi:hypothetical protein